MDTCHDDWSRDVYCLFGIPVDNVGIRETAERIETALRSRARFLISTPNVNFLINSVCDEAFRQTLVFSDLCLPDGMWLVWLGRLAGIPIKTRVPGADVLEILKVGRSKDRPLNVFLFGGPEGAAEKASHTINLRGDAVHCVGFANPGFVSVEQICTDDTIAAVNSSRADFLLVALGAKKGQLWLHRNHGQLTIPVRAHFGAAINFYAGKIKRAPRFLQLCGLEWAWRIKEEPMLWRRYAHDGLYLASALLPRIPLLLAWFFYLKLSGEVRRRELTLTETTYMDQRVILLGGSLTAPNVVKAAAAFRVAVSTNEKIVIDLSGARAVDARFLGLFMMLEKSLRVRGHRADFVGASRLIEFVMRLYGFRIPRGASTAKAVPAGRIDVTAADQ